MCGIAGFVGFEGIGSKQEVEETLRRMTDAVAYRGPDDCGKWIDSEAGVGLGHRRLSIVDLSPTGRQPMASACGRYVVTLNGEIYNHKELRRELGAAPGRSWRGSSDTEVMLAAISAWGLTAALKRVTGMYAFALWDRQEQALNLVRDRAGEKPLYYGWAGRSLVFGSQLKSLRLHPAWSGQIDPTALTQYIRYGFVPAPLSIYRGLFKLPPASVITVDRKALEPARRDPDRPLPHVEYWSPDPRAEAAQPAADEAVTQLDALLAASVRDQMVADVPVGAFLSGGIDSSTVVAIMQKLSARPIRTFTIGFTEDSYNEARYAKAIAKHLGTQHTELYVTPAEAREVIPLLHDVYDEPFGDSSQIPTYLISKLARREVTVSLSGDGGDELFGGYPRYLLAERVWRHSRRLPAAARRGAARLAQRTLEGISLVPSRERLLRLLGALQSESCYDFYQYFISHLRRPASVVVRADDRYAAEPAGTSSQPQDIASALIRFDLARYLPDDILVKVDRAAMANSLETRVPLLDHRIVDFAQQLPLDRKIRAGETKWILRQVLYRYVPKRLVERPKMGFGIPVAAWLRGPLRGWASDLLERSRMKQAGFLDPEVVHKMWSDHLRGIDHWQHSLWDILMFQSWVANQDLARGAA